ncbi:glucosyl-3-phosphoglycerate synthase [Nocardia transvalensis]|uniref:Glucosyl-3-phosphoglycerate synthase n=1 Tax=Nocardia transvalensis TaxID=37333 RepID=A0A7W9PJW9_9NOCA|nr:glucosyl-3-phosphoglycerate synthase [Nocardia transvalensis]MBB5917546.1 glucosyl-3-phosphoglycerate synthase [Nocardia transvalensis]
MTLTTDTTGTAWFRGEWSLPELMEYKGGRGISVVIPALDEQDTVGGVIASIRDLVGTLVDELVVVDSGSTDATIARARAAGATAVYTREEALPSLPPRPGKGEVLWRSLAVTTGDIVVFIDSDLREPDPRFVPSLVAPLLVDDGLRLVKGCYRRPLGGDPSGDADGGGRVTQLVARPLLAALAPELADVVQPLGGEYAATRDLLTAVPFAPGYGVEIGILLDTWRRHGAAAIGQVDLGTRVHRNRPTHELAVMSRQIVATMLDRLGIQDSGIGLTQYRPDGACWRRYTTPVSLEDRPAMADLLTHLLAP